MSIIFVLSITRTALLTRPDVASGVPRAMVFVELATAACL
jgi:hypothetical protein